MPFCIISISLFSTASSCGGSEDNRPLMDTVTERCDLRIGSCTLHYDLSKLIAEANDQYKDISGDLRELSLYNRIYSDMGPYFITLSDLFQTEYSYNGTGAKVEFRLIDDLHYKDYVRIYNNYDDNLLDGIITNVPRLTYEHTGVFAAQSLTTRTHSIVLKWEKYFFVNNGETSPSLLDITNPTMESDFYVKTGVSKGCGGNSGGGGGGLILAAADIIDDTIQPKDNTFSDTPAPGIYDVCITGDIPLASNLFNQGVFVAGEYKEHLRWKRPVIIELRKSSIEISD